MNVDLTKMLDEHQALKKRILNFWFGEPDSNIYGKSRAEWFKKDAAFDQKIRRKFLDDVEEAISGGYKFLPQTQMGSLALILLLDQFPRNLFRGTARAFAGDKKALQLANEAVRNRYDQDLPAAMQMFFYLPFEHSESLDDQQRCLDLFKAAGNDDLLKWAQAHYDIIKRFGRFPHRNEALGRESTDEETAFLEEPNSSF